jgi:hypothetical protein
MKNEEKLEDSRVSNIELGYANSVKQTFFELKQMDLDLTTFS